MVEASVSLTSSRVEALVSPRVVVTLSVSVKNDNLNAKTRGYVAQSTSKKLRKQWRPKNELNLAIETSGKGQNNISSEGPEFHSPQIKQANKDEYSHSPETLCANEEKNSHSRGKIHKRKIKGRPWTFKYEINFTHQEEVPVSDSASL